MLKYNNIQRVLSPVSDLPSVCGEDSDCDQQRLPAEAHPQWRGDHSAHTPIH